jgi:FixJ family two-component response regulator
MQQQPLTVFVVDDDESVRNSLRVVLKSVGLTARALSSPAEFLRSYKPGQPVFAGPASAVFKHRPDAISIHPN